MTNNKIKRYILLFFLLGLSTGFCIAQDQSEFDKQDMLPPEALEDADIDDMAPPLGFEENALDSFRMRRPPRRRGHTASRTMDMYPPKFDENASETFKMRRPPMGGRPPRGVRPPMGGRSSMSGRPHMDDTGSSAE